MTNRRSAAKQSIVGVLSFDIGTRNLAFALVDVDDDGGAYCVQRVGVIDLGSNVSRIALERLRDVLASAAFAWAFDVDIVDAYVIEQQPSNGVFKQISLNLAAHFSMHDSLILGGAVLRPVRMMSPLQKFKLFPDLYDKNLTYVRRKEAGVEMARRILASACNESARSFFEAHAFKQQTDMADAIIQACQYLKEQQR